MKAPRSTVCAGSPETALDLSSAVAPWSYHVPAVPIRAWQHAPDDFTALLAAASRVYGTDRLLAVAGSSAAARALPRVQQRWRSRARVVVSSHATATHAAAWSRAGHAVRAASPAAFEAALDEADVAVVCQPEPTGHAWSPSQLLAWRERLAARGGWMIVDEAGCDAQPALSVVGAAGEPGLIVLRSLSPFFGLAGARLGFVATRPMLLDALAEELGPCSVSGPAAWAGEAALRDEPWQQAQRSRLSDASARLAALCGALGSATLRSDAGVCLHGPGAAALHDALLQRAVRTQRLDIDGGVHLRIGLPADEGQWTRLAQAMGECLSGKEAPC